MPGSLQSPPRSRITRNESTHSDHSDGSNTSQSSAAGKKVSFSKAVRVKKYVRPKKNSLFSNGDVKTNGSAVNGGPPSSGSPEKRFWFKVYKNKHRQSPDPKELRTNDVIYYDNDIGNNGIHRTDADNTVSYHPNPSPLNYPVITSECGTQTPPKDPGTRHFGSEPAPLHPSQMPTEPPHVRRDHVKKIVNRFNEEAVFTRQRSSEGDMSPPESPLISPRHHSTPKRAQRIPTPPPEPPVHYEAKHHAEGTSKFKKNPIVNGVKVIFGMGQLKKKGKTESSDAKHYAQNHKSQETDTSDFHAHNGKVRGSDKHSHKTEVYVSDDSDTETKTPYDKTTDYRQENKASQEIVKRHKGGLFRHENATNGGYDDFFNEDDEYSQRRGKVHVETFDSGNQLVFDTADVNTASTKTDRGELFCTVGEKHQLWQNNKRIVVYEEPSPKITRRKAKSHSDLSNAREDHVTKARVDKGVSTEHLSSSKHEGKPDFAKRTKDSWLRLWRNNTKDKGIQCSKVPTDDDLRRDEAYTSGKYKIVRPRNGVVSAYSNVPSLEKLSPKSRTESTVHTDDYNTSAISSSYHNGDIYSQVDKSKKRRDAEKKKSHFGDEGKRGGLFKSRSEPLYIGPAPKERQSHYDDQHSSYYEEDGDHTIKTSKRSFGFRLNPGREEIVRKGHRTDRNLYREENWYDVDDDVKAVEKLRGRGSDHRDISEIREEIADDEFASDLSSNGDRRRNDVGAGSVMREVDYKKREISYENVPRSDGESNVHTGTSVGSGLWFRDADEDYRREMAQSEVSYPAGNQVGSDRFYTISRTDKVGKQKPPPSPRAYTLDRRHFKEKKKGSNPSGIKILVNGKEVSENGRSSKKNKGYYRRSRTSEDPSSVQSDPLYVRGGLAAAYQARQRAAVRRSNSSVAGIAGGYRTSSPVAGGSRYRGMSEASGGSSETESAHARKPLIMYIPGISHYEKSPEEGDRSSGVNVARSQSMMTSSRPSRISSKKSRHKSSKQDLYRNTDLYEEDEIMPLASEVSRKKPPKVPYDSKKNSDIKRRHSMPKDTKFSWLKWKIRGKPSREP